MKSLWKFVLMISIVTVSCKHKTIQQNTYKHEDRVLTFLKNEKIPTNDAFIFFVKNIGCPCVEESIKSLAKYKDRALNTYLFADFKTDTIKEVIDFKFDTIFEYDNAYFEKHGLVFSTPKVFIFKHQQVIEWRDY